MSIHIHQTTQRSTVRRRTALAFLIAAFAFVLALSGCGGGGGKGGGGGTTVTGTVKDSAQSDAGVGGATVTIGGASAITVTSDQATSTNPVGSFTITGAAVGATTATITPAGQSAQTVAFSPSIASGANSVGDLFINIGQLQGKILLPDGSPASGAFVSLSADGNTITTGADGSFLIINVPLGETKLTAVSGTASLSIDVTVGTGVTDVGSKTLVEDSNPNPPSIPKTIAGTAHLGGVGGGVAASGAQVFLLRGGTQIEVTTVDSVGNYWFYVPVGTYSIIIRATTFQDGNAGPITVSDPNTTVTVPDVTLQPQ